VSRAGKSAAAAVAAFIVIGTAAAWWSLVLYGKSPARPGAPACVVVIGRGVGISAVSGVLHSRGIIRHPFMFRLLYAVFGDGRTVKAGEYMLSAGMSPSAILEKLLKGDVVLHRLTVPEGYTMRQIAELAERAGLCGKDAFLCAATDRAFAARMGIDADSFEGYLFPDTYYFPASIGPEKIIETMVGRFWAVFSDKWKKRAAMMGLTIHQVVTLASIIEKETASGSERPLISSVFHNRLARGMRLESDPTVIYGIQDFNGNLTRDDLRRRTPYNTYRVKGLPPGPIANPGRDALHAALYPASTGYLYFVSRNDGTHQFSATLEEHSRAVRKYQLHRQ